MFLHGAKRQKFLIPTSPLPLLQQGSRSPVRMPHRLNTPRSSPPWLALEPLFLPSLMSTTLRMAMGMGMVRPSITRLSWISLKSMAATTAMAAMISQMRQRPRITSTKLRRYPHPLHHTPPLQFPNSRAFPPHPEPPRPTTSRVKAREREMEKERERRASRLAGTKLRMMVIGR
ncbi:hypothetical protein HOY80DRAFT_996050 [Tuber brumale]|nr:hypothetical protein HOY80DRAFT_996050 [Tuber brumale]